MNRCGIGWHLVLGVALFLAPALAGAAEISPIRLDDFEGGLQGWRFVGGEEFPGAKGEMALDSEIAHGGKHSCRLRADFRGGGAYVGVWRDLASLKGLEFKELRFWVKASGVARIGFRINDSTGQCHQTKSIRLPGTIEWQPVVLKLSDLVGGEHWGGANDGKWHGPATGFGFNIGKDGLASGAAQGTLHLDDVELVPGTVFEGHPTVLACVANPARCRPGFGSRITYRWLAEPMGHDYKAFVHVRGPRGEMAIQADHDLPVSTAIWSGPVEYAKTLVIPEQLPDGEYRIVLGLYDPRASDRGWDRQTLKCGEGVHCSEEGAYQVGTIVVDSKMPVPKLPAPTLSLDGYQMTFNEEFDDLSVSAWGPGTRWIAHTPNAKDFGDARFTDPSPGFPFTVEKGILRIEASKKDGRWRSGLLASVDPKGRGFSQKFGYFEARAKFPKSPGMWPAFWLLGVTSLTDKNQPTPEIDVVEQYGVHPKALHATLHVWRPNGTHWAEGDVFIAPGMDEDFHKYGVKVEETDITWYFDGIEIFRQKTPNEAKVPLYLLVNLAMGSGWPIDKAVSPSYMEVDYVRAYQKR